MARALFARVGRIERAVGVVCHACTGRPETGMMVFEFGGRLIDGRGNDIDPAHLEPCPRCGRGGVGKVIEGVDPGEMLGVRAVRGIDPAIL
jgi:hypothetical protein